jgi:hypothetical protein
MSQRRLTLMGDLDQFRALAAHGPGTAPPPKRARTDKTAPRPSRVTIEQTFAADDDSSADGAWKPVGLQRKAWTPDSCFGCEYGLSTPDETQPGLRGLWDLFRDSFAREMPNECLAELMHEYFEAHIRQPTLARGGTCPEWPAKRILEHIEVHLLCPAVTLGVQLQNMKFVERLILQELRVQHTSTGDRKVDLKVLKSLVELQRHIQTLYNAKPARQIFYSQFLKLDDQRGNQ